MDKDWLKFHRLSGYASFLLLAVMLSYALIIVFFGPQPVDARSYFNLARQGPVKALLVSVLNVPIALSAYFFIFLSLWKLLKDIDAQGVVVPVEELDLVDAKEMEGLKAALDSSDEPWLRLLNEHLYELKRRTHSITKLSTKGDRPQEQIDEWNTAVDTLEKNCNCYIKRNRFPTQGDRYGLLLKEHLVKILPSPLQGLGEEQLHAMKEERRQQGQQLKQAMAAFIGKAKSLSEDYHSFMAQHCVLNEKKAEVCAIFAKGRELYLGRQWDGAIAEFKKGLALVADDGPCLKFIERCEKFKKNPPGEDWDGTWEANW